MHYSIVSSTEDGKELATIHENITGYAVAEHLYSDIIQAAKDRGRAVAYDFASLKGNRKPIAMRAIISADTPKGASYFIDLILHK